ncbi:MAG: molybdopterin-dependent oxidoreductase [Terracoccus sp.]
MSRRGFLTTVGVGVVGAAALTGGQTFGWLEPLNLFGARTRGLGPQGLPINRTAAQAGVEGAAVSADWRLSVATAAGSSALSRDALLALPQTEAVLPIACVEGWSSSVRWSGVAVPVLLASVGAPPESRLRFTSLEPSGAYRVMEMGPEYAADPLTLVALAIDGEALHLEHGYPARVIAPGRPGVLQTKWLRSVEVI